MIDEITDNVNKMFAPYEVFLVGGAVRDHLIGLEPKDYDYCTAASVEDIERIIRAAGRKPYLTGKRFGTIGFKLQTSDGIWRYIEITTFRKEIYTPGSRKPEVEFISDLKEDLSRRDLTIGAIAYRDQTYYDPFSGRLDILERKLKAVGKAKDRYTEDPLRMLRVARFAAQLDFEVDPNLIGTIRRMAPRILSISRERWMQELTKLLVQEHVSKGIDVLVDTCLLKFMVPEAYLIAKLYRDELINVVSNAPKTPDARWGALLCFIGRPYTDPKKTRNGDTIFHNQHLIAAELTKGIALRLKWPNDLREHTIDIVTSYGDQVLHINREQAIISRTK